MGAYRKRRFIFCRSWSVSGTY
ncbi:hypothetical protein PM8797T_21143 [Gimesia maris DSM 8797]|nr:hypothetical protein PM8797T_21143 [Gimesia maris DSM 8797]